MSKANESSTVGYISRFRDWDEKARVRVSPRRLLAEEESVGKQYFSQALVPVARHPIIRELGPSAVRTTLIQHLDSYLDFTAQFEIEVVNSVTRSIARAKSGFDLPEEMRFDAYKIYCDEGYHSVFSADLRNQVAAVTGVPSVGYDLDSFLTRFEMVKDAVPPEVRPLIGTFVVILFETLISATLNKVPGDESVVTAVRDTVQDHADDEARHHFYFAKLMDLIWPRLENAHRSIIGPLLPAFIIKCLEPDYPAIERRLVYLGLNRDQVRQVMEESYPADHVISGIRKTARATLGILARNGLFEELRNREAFESHGLRIETDACI
ncbi:MAG: diiron oxygenase [Blastocatellia bacterium]